MRSGLPAGLTAAVVLCCLLASAGAASERPFPLMRGPYLGQAPPELFPQPFAWGVLCTEAMESAVAVSPEASEIFLARRPSWEGNDDHLLVVKEVNGVWGKPAPAPFAQSCAESAPSFSPNGERLFFLSSRPKPAGVKRSGDYWAVERTDTGWGRPHYLGAGVNDHDPTDLSVTSEGTVYFAGEHKGQAGLYRALPVKGEYKSAEYLGESVNRLRPAHPFIAPDESYLLFDAPDGAADSLQVRTALFRSVRQADGSWGEPQKLPPTVNATHTESRPVVSADGKYLFFTRAVNRNMDLYWVSARVLAKMQPGVSPAK
jgi:hypothetical protein